MQDLEKKFTAINGVMGGRVKRDVKLAQFTTFKIGGPATMFFTAKNNDDLVTIVGAAKKLKIPFFILSGGSNVLIDDQGIDELVIHIKTNDLIVRENKIIVDSGVTLARLVEASIDNGLEGLVWASGIPGDVGGAIRGNAGAYGGEISDNLTSVEIIRGSKEFVIKRDSIDFSYRDSSFKHNSDILLVGEFTLKETGNRDMLKAQSSEIIALREKKHPHAPSAGSFFKNIPITYENEQKFKDLNVPNEYLEYKKVPTGWLLDQLEMRGTKVGGAMISDEHANIVINTGTATFNDVLELTQLMRDKVLEKFDIKIEAEVQIIRA